MTQNRDFFKPESVDEQIDRFSLSFLDAPGMNQEQMETRRVKEFLPHDQIEHQQDASTRLVRELQIYYQGEHQQNLGFLERARQRIAAHQPANHASAQLQNSLLSSPILRSSQERLRMMQSQPSTDHSGGRKKFRRASLLAATLVAALLVGMLVTALTLSHNHQGSTIATGQTVTPATAPSVTATSLPAGSIVSTRYFRTAMNLFPPIAWSPDSKRIATLVINPDNQQTQLQIWNATIGGNLLTVPFAYTFNEVLWSPTGKYLALDNLSTIVIVDSQTGATVNTINSNAVTASSTSIAGQSLLSSRLPASDGTGFDAVAWTPDGVSLAVAVSYATGGKIKLINPLTSALNVTFNTNASMVATALAFSSDGRYLATTYPRDSRIVVWKVSTQAVVFQQNDVRVETVSWQPGTHNLARKLTFSAAVQLWDINSRKLVKTYAGITSFTWSSDGKKLAAYTSINDMSGSAKTKMGEVVIIDATSGTQVAVYKSQYSSIYTVSWSPNGRYLASAEPGSTGGNQISIWIA